MHRCRFPNEKDFEAEKNLQLLSLENPQKEKKNTWNYNYLTGLWKDSYSFVEANCSRNDKLKWTLPYLFPDQWFKYI